MCLRMIPYMEIPPRQELHPIDSARTLRGIMREISADDGTSSVIDNEESDTIIMVPIDAVPIDVTGDVTIDVTADKINDRDLAMSLPVSIGTCRRGNAGSRYSHRSVSTSDGSVSVDSLSSSEFPDSRMANILRFKVENPDYGFAQLLLTHTCYDVIPSSTKVVVFDEQLSVKKAFFGLLFNCTRAALVCRTCDTDIDVMGILSVTDFITVLLHFYDEKKAGIDGTRKLEDHSIKSWRELLGKKRPHKRLVTVPANGSLYMAARCLSDHKVHRVPVLDPETGDPMYFVTHKRLLKFLWVFGKTLPRANFMDKTPKELGLGVWGEDVVKTYPDTPLVHVLRDLVTRNLSGIPIVTRLTPSRPDLSNIVIDIYSRFDVIHLASSGNFEDIETPVEAALAYRALDKQTFGGIVKCLQTDDFHCVLERLVDRSVHRIVVVDEKGALVGLLSLSDILRFLVTDRKVKDIVASTNAAVREIVDELDVKL